MFNVENQKMINVTCNIIIINNYWEEQKSNKSFIKAISAMEYLLQMYTGKTPFGSMKSTNAS